MMMAFSASAGFRHIRQEGFRKSPYASLQTTAGGYFSTGAYRVRLYRGMDAMLSERLISQCML